MAPNGLPQTINGKVYIETDNGYEEIGKVENVEITTGTEEVKELQDLAASNEATFTLMVTQLNGVWDSLTKAVELIANKINTLLADIFDIGFTESNNYRRLHGKPARRGISNNPYYHYLKKIGFSDKEAEIWAKRLKKGKING